MFCLHAPGLSVDSQGQRLILIVHINCSASVACTIRMNFSQMDDLAMAVFESDLLGKTLILFSLKICFQISNSQNYVKTAIIV
jgi:hypothetical protein